MSIVESISMRKILIGAFVLLSSVISAPGESPQGGDEGENTPHHIAATGLTIIPIGPDAPRVVPGGTPAVAADRPAPAAPRRGAGRRFFPFPNDPVVQRLVFE